MGSRGLTYRNRRLQKVQAILLCTFFILSQIILINGSPAIATNNAYEEQSIADNVEIQFTISEIKDGQVKLLDTATGKSLIITTKELDREGLIVVGPDGEECEIVGFTGKAVLLENPRNGEPRIVDLSSLKEYIISSKSVESIISIVALEKGQKSEEIKEAIIEQKEKAPEPIHGLVREIDAYPRLNENIPKKRDIETENKNFPEPKEIVRPNPKPIITRESKKSAPAVKRTGVETLKELAIIVSSIGEVVSNPVGARKEVVQNQIVVTEEPEPELEPEPEPKPELKPEPEPEPEEEEEKEEKEKEEGEEEEEEEEEEKEEEEKEEEEEEEKEEEEDKDYGKYAYVTNMGSGTISIIDTDKDSETFNQVIAEVPLPKKKDEGKRSPISVAVTPVYLSIVNNENSTIAWDKLTKVYIYTGGEEASLLVFKPEEYFETEDVDSSLEVLAEYDDIQNDTRFTVEEYLEWAMGTSLHTRTFRTDKRILYLNAPAHDLNAKSEWTPTLIDAWDITDADEVITDGDYEELRYYSTPFGFAFNYSGRSGMKVLTYMPTGESYLNDYYGEASGMQGGKRPLNNDTPATGIAASIDPRDFDKKTYYISSPTTVYIAKALDCPRVVGKIDLKPYLETEDPEGVSSAIVATADGKRVYVYNVYANEDHKVFAIDTDPLSPDCKKVIDVIKVGEDWITDGRTISEHGLAVSQNDRYLYVVIPTNRGEEGALDIMLVTDRSGSMRGDKIEAARTAGKVFVDCMDLDVDQVGLASFNSSATLDHQLSQDGNSVKAAIDKLKAVGGTAIDAGIKVGMAELLSERRNPKAKPVMIILSDGCNNAGRDPVIAAAEVAKKEGIYIVTIGLGEGADEVLLKAVASSPDDYYFAPDADSLDEIYEEIAEDIRNRKGKVRVIQLSTNDVIAEIEVGECPLDIAIPRYWDDVPPKLEVRRSLNKATDLDDIKTILSLKLKDTQPCDIGPYKNVRPGYFNIALELDDSQGDLIFPAMGKAGDIYSGYEFTAIDKTGNFGSDSTVAGRYKVEQPHGVALFEPKNVSFSSKPPFSPSGMVMIPPRLPPAKKDLYMVAEKWYRGDNSHMGGDRLLQRIKIKLPKELPGEPVPIPFPPWFRIDGYGEYSIKVIHPLAGGVEHMTHDAVVAVTPPPKIKNCSIAMSGDSISFTVDSESGIQLGSVIGDRTPADFKRVKSDNDLARFRTKKPLILPRRKGTTIVKLETENTYSRCWPGYKLKDKKILTFKDADDGAIQVTVDGMDEELILRPDKPITIDF